MAYEWMQITVINNDGCGQVSGHGRYKIKCKARGSVAFIEALESPPSWDPLMGSFTAPGSWRSLDKKKCSLAS